MTKNVKKKKPNLLWFESDLLNKENSLRLLGVFINI